MKCELEEIDKKLTICKSWDKKSSGDVIFGMPHPLLIETTFGRNVENCETFKNSQTVADKRVKHAHKRTIFNRPIER